MKRLLSTRRTRRFLALGGLLFFLAHGAGSAVGQERSTNSPLQSTLLGLVGQKCEVHLKNGDVVKGTLWDFGDTFVTLKVKKGLLYSKAEKFEFSQIDYVSGPGGEIIRPTQTSETSEDTEDKGESGLLFFKTGDLVAEEETSRAAAEKPQPKTTADALASLRSRDKTRDVSTTRTKPTPPTRPTSRPQPREKSAKEVLAEQNRSTSKQVATLSKRETSPKPVRAKEITPTVTGPESATMPPEIMRSRSPKVAVAGDAVDPKVERDLRILKYRAAILFGVAGFTFALLVFFKALGLNGALTAKQALFPAHLVQLNGQYGIIDQGSEDGVKVDDVIRLYRKNGKQVEYRGKVKVVKVADAYSAVKILRAKHNGMLLEVGDVGFRDRNLVATTLKKLRLAMGVIFGVVAKIFEVAARNLEAESEEESRELDFFPEPSTGSKTKARKKARPKTVKNQDVSISVKTVETRKQETQKVGFGVD